LSEKTVEKEKRPTVSKTATEGEKSMEPNNLLSS